MTLKDKTLEERKKLTKAYPMLISAYAGSGKSTCVEFLPEEDKARTIIFLAENKQLPEDDESLYRTIYRLKTEGENPTDSGNVKFRTIEEYLPLIKKAIAHEEVDRIVLDSFTAYVDTLERTYTKLHNGFTIWVEFSKHLYDLFAVLKNETYTHAKYVYILGHYVPSKDAKERDGERFTKVAGSKHYRMVEANFNTVLTIEDFKFVADNEDQFSSTRIKRSLNPYESKENSLAELEEAFSK